MQNQDQERKVQQMALQDALRHLSEAVTLEQVLALNEEVDTGFAADVPTVQFSDADWPLWTEAVRNKAQSIEASVQQKLAEEDVMWAKEQRKAADMATMKSRVNPNREVVEIQPEALLDPEYRAQVQGLKDITAALNGEDCSPVVFSTDRKVSDAEVLERLPRVLADLVQAVEFTPLGVRGIKAVQNAKQVLGDVPNSGYAPSVESLSHSAPTQTVVIAEAVAKAVFDACKRQIDKGRSLDGLNLDVITQCVVNTLLESLSEKARKPRSGPSGRI